MKTFLVISVTTCLFVMGLAQNMQECTTRFSDLSSYPTTLTAGGGGGNFCDDCANQLISYYEDCTNGVGITGVWQSKLRLASS